MNWNDIKVFLAIAEAGSLSGAATLLKNNHSTIFRRLNAIEEDLEARLFERMASGYVLTPTGIRMLEIARDIDNSVSQIEREIVGHNLSPMGTVAITSAPNIARTILPPAIKRLKKNYPQIVIDILVGDKDYDMNRREADIALRATKKPPEHLIGRKVMDIDWWICTSISNRNKLPKKISDLQHFSLIGADVDLLRLDAFQWLEENFNSNIVARANDLSTMASLSMSGIGLALLPSDQNEKGLRRLFKLPDFKGELWLLTHPDLRDVQRIKVVWETLINEIMKVN
jgi:DNA-binding transcriptional LysR family regulator